jgi:hypothetical protein
MKQSPIRKLRRDWSRLMQELTKAESAGDGPAAEVLRHKIQALGKEIAAMEAARGDAD